MFTFITSFNIPDHLGAEQEMSSGLSHFRWRDWEAHGCVLETGTRRQGLGHLAQGSPLHTKGKKHCESLRNILKTKIVFIFFAMYLLEMLVNYQIMILLMNFKTYSNSGKDTVKSELPQITGAGRGVNWHSPFRKHLGNTYQGSVLEEEENCCWDFWKAFTSLRSWTSILCPGWAGFLTVFWVPVRTSLLHPPLDSEPRDLTEGAPTLFSHFCISFQSPHATLPLTVW